MATAPEIKVTAEAQFVREESQPHMNRYLFAYHIRIKNHGTTPAQLVSRHWIITNGNGAVHEVRGDGVVGKQPMLLPNDEFSYTSSCPLDTPIGMMQGEYTMVDASGTSFSVTIDPFILSADQHFN